jgi:hypothetical protein
VSVCVWQGAGVLVGGCMQVELVQRAHGLCNRCVGEDDVFQGYVRTGACRQKVLRPSHPFAPAHCPRP